MHKFKVLVSSVSLLSLLSLQLAFAYSKKDRAKVVDQILSNKMAGIAFQNARCGYRFVNKETGEIYGKEGTKKTEVIAVPPGRYALSSMGCQYQRTIGSKIYKYRFNTDDPELWFNDTGFEVKAGAVTYPGTIWADMASYRPSGIQIENPFKTQPQAFPIYRVGMQEEQLKKGIKKRFSELSDRLVLDKLEPRLDPNIIQDIVQSAYQSEEGGEKIKTSIGDRKAQLKYGIYIRTGIAPKI